MIPFWRRLPVVLWFLLLLLAPNGVPVEARTRGPGHRPPPEPRPGASGAPAVADIRLADQKFKKKLYEEALGSYAAVAASETQAASDRLRARYRALECEVLLFRFDEAERRLEASALPDGPVGTEERAWHARFEILKAELAREWIKQYGGYAEGNEEEIGNTDVTKRPRAEWHKRIREAWADLWERRDELLATPVSREGDFLDLENAQLALAPTLWDFVVLRWSEYLLQEAPDSDEGPNALPESAPAKPAFHDFIGEHYAPGAELAKSASFSRWAKGRSRAEQAAGLFEASAIFPAHGRAVAAELWRLSRLFVAIQHGDLVKARSGKGAGEDMDRARDRLQKWFEGGLSEKRPRGLAGAAAAHLFDERGHYADAVALCEKVEVAAHGTPGSVDCRDLRISIETPRLGASGYPVPPDGKQALRLNTRNLE